MRTLTLAAGFLQDRRGSAAVQFALLAPLMLLVILGSFEVAIAIYLDASLEAAVLAASRTGTTGASAEGVSREEQIKTIIARRTFGWVTAESATIRTLVYASFEQIGQAEPFVDANHNGRHDAGERFTDLNGNGTWDSDAGTPGLGGPNDIVLYEVDFTAGPITGLVRAVIPAFLHHAAVAVRNEPY